MKHRLVNSQLNNWSTYQLYTRKMLTLAENVFIYKNLPKFIDIGFVNSCLVRKGAVAFFKDEVLQEVVALPFNTTGRKDMYGRPTQIEVFGENGYHRVLNLGEFVIMYDNSGKFPIYYDIEQHAERMALIKRTEDVNISQQKTPRIWKTPTEKERSLKDIINNVDGMEEAVLTYDDINLDNTECVLSPAPYVVDQLDIHKENEWSEFLQLIGIANLSVQKKERNISDEVQAMLGGTIASRYSRFEPRKKAVEEINEKFGTNIEVLYYDGTPNEKEYYTNKDETTDEEIGDEDDVL